MNIHKRNHNGRFLALTIMMCSIAVSETMALVLPPRPVSTGVYRLPYANGTDVRFGNDHTNHPARLNRVDMSGRNSSSYTIVAAAAGWIMKIVEDHNTFCPRVIDKDTDDDGNISQDEYDAAQSEACDGYAGTAAFCCERNYEDSGQACPNGGTCEQNVDGPNNFVWILHPNGEWSKYSHMQTNSTGPNGFGHLEGDWVNAGDAIGLEGDIGNASGPHLHFEVAVPNYVERLTELQTANGNEADPDFQPPEWEHLFSSDGFLKGDGIQDDVIDEDPDGDGVPNPDDDVNRQNRIPIFCQIGFAEGSENVTAVSCDDACGNVWLDIVGTYTNADSPVYEQVSDDIGNGTGNLLIETKAGVSLRADNRVILLPGFRAELDSFFAGSAGACDSPGGTGD